jgi:hypothetical protein
MTPETLTHHLTTLPAVTPIHSDAHTFFFRDPDRKMPFATIVTSDAFDQASNLNRPSAFRLNLSVSKATYRHLFGPPPPFPATGGIINTGHDFTALDQLLPHPLYAAMSWICILNPSHQTFQKTLQPLLAEAYDLAAPKQTKSKSEGEP